MGLITTNSFDLQLDRRHSNIRPRVWQRQLIQLLRRRLININTQGRDLLVHAGPGAGKTLGALLGFKAMQQEGLLSGFLVFCHRNSILSQWRSSSEKLGLSLEDLDTWQDQKDLASVADGLIVSYQGATKRLDAIRETLRVFNDKRFLAIADEAHHLGVDPEEPDGQVWGKTFLDLTESSTLRLGLTGTPFRADNLAFCSARKVRLHEQGALIEQITPDLCVEPRELISAGDVRPLEFHFQDGWVEHSSLGHPDREVSLISRESRESWRARNLRRAIRLSDSSSIAVQLVLRARLKLEMIRLKHSNAAGLVIAKDIDHAIAISNLLRENGESVMLVHSQEQNSSEYLSSFQESQDHWLVSVDMCSEGFDAPRLRVVAYITTVATRSRFLQAITRAVRMSSTRALLEPVPRHPSYVFAPADPLLMEYARSWSISKPYLIRRDDTNNSIGGNTCISRGPSLPMEAVNDGAGEVIRMRVAQLPNFLK